MRSLDLIGQSYRAGASQACMTEFVRPVCARGWPAGRYLGGAGSSELAEQLGQLMRLVAETMKQLLEARQVAKRLSRSSSQTMVHGS